MYRKYEENANDKNKNVEFWWETAKLEALFFSEIHLKTWYWILGLMLFRTTVKTVFLLGKLMLD